jgi:hypothetical protein
MKQNIIDRRLFIKNTALAASGLIAAYSAITPIPWATGVRRSVLPDA